MGQIRLRKCAEHEACQLQSNDGGEWQHTPARTPLAQRLARNPEDIEKLERRLAGEVGAAIALRVRLGERLVHLEDRLRHLEDSIQGLPVVKRLHDEAARLGEVLAGSQSELEGRANRLERDVARLDRFTTRLEEAAAITQEQSDRAGKDAAAAAETATHLGQRTPRIDAALSRMDEYLAKLSRVQDLYDVVASLQGESRAGDAALRSDLNEAMRLIDKERGERIEGYLKVQRQFREVNRG